MQPAAEIKNKLIVTNKTPIKQKNKTGGVLQVKSSHFLISPQGGGVFEGGLNGQISQMSAFF